MWTDLYAPVNGHLLCVDAKYPERFESAGKEIQQKLKSSPDDVSLIAYAAEYQAIQGNWHEALALARRARKATDICYQFEAKSDAKDAKEMRDLNLQMVRGMEKSYKHRQLGLPLSARGDNAF